MRKITVIGSGISGLSISRMLSEQFEVQILERSANAGGLVKCDRINGNLFHKVGGHVFNSKNEIVLNWFWQYFDREEEFLHAQRNAKIMINNALIGYPLENHLYQLPPDQSTDIIEQLTLMSLIAKENQSSYTNFKDFLIGNFGQKLYDLYFGPYNTKIWNTDIGNVPLEWLDDKLPKPDIKEILQSNAQKQNESDMVHASFYYPKRDGSQFIINRLAENQNIRFSYSVEKIAFISGRLLINDDIFSDKLIFSGDVRQLYKIINIENNDLRDALRSVTDLKSNGTSTVLCETDENDISWLYIPEKQYKAHRIIYTGNFSATNNEGTLRNTCVVEFSGQQDRDNMIKELKSLPGNLKPLAFNYEPNSYIIQEKDTRKKIKALKTLLGDYNIHLLGRFAEWEYYNMDKCIESAMRIARSI